MEPLPRPGSVQGSKINSIDTGGSRTEWKVPDKINPVDVGASKGGSPSSAWGESGGGILQETHIPEKPVTDQIQARFIAPFTLRLLTPG